MASFDLFGDDEKTINESSRGVLQPLGCLLLKIIILLCTLKPHQIVFFMKKLFYTIILLLGFSSFVCSCEKVVNGGDALVGTWDMNEEGEEINGKYRKFDEADLGACCYVFSKTTLTIFDEEDMMDGSSMKYEFENDQIWIMGIAWYDVLVLTTSTLKLRVIPKNGSENAHTIIVFSKR